MEISTFREVMFVGVPQLIVMILAFVLVIHYSRKDQMWMALIEMICVIAMLIALMYTGLGWTETTTEFVPCEVIEEEALWTGSEL